MVGRDTVARPPGIFLVVVADRLVVAGRVGMAVVEAAVL